MYVYSVNISLSFSSLFIYYRARNLKELLPSFLHGVLTCRFCLRDSTKMENMNKLFKFGQRHVCLSKRTRLLDPPPSPYQFCRWPRFQLFSTKNIYLGIILGVGYVRTIFGPSAADRIELQFKRNLRRFPGRCG